MFPNLQKQILISIFQILFCTVYVSNYYFVFILTLKNKKYQQLKKFRNHFRMPQVLYFEVNKMKVLNLELHLEALIIDCKIGHISRFVHI